VFIRSGIRFDYLMYDDNDAFFKKLVSDHVSGQLKVAPEHISDRVLDCMGKPHIDVYNAFKKKYFDYCKEIGKEQYLVPYLMSSHPGSTVNEAIELACYLKAEHYAPEQVQDYYPTPGTASTVMYYTGINPLTGKKVYVPTTYEEKSEQRALLQFNKPDNAGKVRSALIKAGREDLIGFGSECLVRPDRAPHFDKKKSDKKGGTKGNDKGKKNNSKSHSKPTKSVQKGKFDNTKPTSNHSKAHKSTSKKKQR
jgi:radical SAM superfamily enzyme YgiQ (UPF0313 family)